MTAIELRIGVVADFDPVAVKAHRWIPSALQLAEKNLNCAVTWIHTTQATGISIEELGAYDGFWCAPGSPYQSMDGALRVIQYARMHQRPFLGTCGGFQHALIEFARSLPALATADHQESNPLTDLPLISRLSCSLAGQQKTVRLQQGSRLQELLGVPTVCEKFNCNFGLNPSYTNGLFGNSLRAVAFGENGEVFAFELQNHPFFIGTLFQPELQAEEGKAHPLIKAFLGCCVNRNS